MLRIRYTLFRLNYEQETTNSTRVGILGIPYDAVKNDVDMYHKYRLFTGIP